MTSATPGGRAGAAAGASAARGWPRARAGRARRARRVWSVASRLARACQLGTQCRCSGGPTCFCAAAAAALGPSSSHANRTPPLTCRQAVSGVIISADARVTWAPHPTVGLLLRLTKDSPPLQQVTHPNPRPAKKTAVGQPPDKAAAAVRAHLRGVGLGARPGRGRRNGVCLGVPNLGDLCARAAAVKPPAAAGASARGGERGRQRLSEGSALTRAQAT